jgi:hypothetical protein
MFQATPRSQVASLTCSNATEAINRLPFVVKFLCAFQSALNLYLVQDFYAGLFYICTAPWVPHLT